MRCPLGTCCPWKLTLSTQVISAHASRSCGLTQQEGREGGFLDTEWPTHPLRGASGAREHARRLMDGCEAAALAWSSRRTTARVKLSGRAALKFVVEQAARKSGPRIQREGSVVFGSKCVELAVSNLHISASGGLSAARPRTPYFKNFKLSKN